MLVEFSVTNFRSLKNRVSISMLASTDKAHESDLLTPTDNRRLLPLVSIHGANAAGKSNVILALQTMQSFITGENAKLLKDEPLPFDPFAFDEQSKKTFTEYKIVFYYSNIKYSYRFAHDKNRILFEDLFHWPNGREALIFSRNNEKYVFRENEKEQRILSGRTPENRLYFVTSNEWNLPQTERAYKWFSTKLFPYNDHVSPDITNFIRNKDDSLSKRITAELRNADLGIIGLRQIENSEETHPSQNILMIHETEANGVKSIFELDFLHESKGTQRFFSRIGPWISASEEGGILFVDELDSGLHPLMTRRLVEMIQDPCLNPKKAQLLFTTHDVLLMDLSLLRRDQIWFAEKDPLSLSTDLFSLWDFSARKDENIQKGYLQGRFGAIPFFSSLS